LTPSLAVDGLAVEYVTATGPTRALDGVTFTVARDTCLALVGESGSGKSTIAAAVLGVLPDSARATGRVLVAGTPIGPRDGWRRRRSGAATVGYVPQDTGAALNPVVAVVDQVAEVYRVHQRLDRASARRRAAAALASVGVDERVATNRLLPDELSGGMRQRALIAIALALAPSLVVADEPTSSLDPETALGVLDTMTRLGAAAGTAMLLISHDLGLARAVADDVLVLYGGRVMEQGPADDVLADPRHPYTRALIEAAPSIIHPHHRPVATSRDHAANAAPDGCPFTPRCPLAVDRCRTDRPEPRPVGPGRRSACHFAPELDESGHG
jgi:oligopeptide/dipeptide ABC transporter ATP-binding protein